MNNLWFYDNYNNNDIHSDTAEGRNYVHVRFTSAMLVYGIQWAKVKNFHHRYEETQAANRPSFAYYNTDNCLSNLY